MPHNNLLSAPLAAAILAIAGQLVAAADGPTRPNIVLFFVDDFGQRDLSCYGSSLYETPHMDQLAAQGMRFTKAYAAYPRCVPSRQGLLSGKYPNRIESEAIKTGNHEHHLPLREVTFGEALKKFGYRTCYIGKWHLGHDGGDPGAQGFDTVVHAGSAGRQNQSAALSGESADRFLDLLEIVGNDGFQPPVIGRAIIASAK